METATVFLAEAEPALEQAAAEVADFLARAAAAAWEEAEDGEGVEWRIARSGEGDPAAAEVVVFLFAEQLTAQARADCEAALAAPGRADSQAKPLVAAWFKELGPGQAASLELAQLRARLELDGGSVCCDWPDLPTVKLGLAAQIEAWGHTWLWCIDAGSLVVGGEPVADLTEGRLYTGFQGLGAVSARFAQLQARLESAEAAEAADAVGPIDADQPGGADHAAEGAADDSGDAGRAAADDEGLAALEAEADELAQLVEDAETRLTDAVMTVANALTPGLAVAPEVRRAGREFLAGRFDAALAELSETSLRAQGDAALARLGGAPPAAQGEPTASGAAAGATAAGVGVEVGAGEAARRVRDAWLMRFEILGAKVPGPAATQQMEVALRQASDLEKRAGLAVDAMMQLADFLRWQDRPGEIDEVYQDVTRWLVEGDCPDRVPALLGIATAMALRGIPKLAEAALAGAEALVAADPALGQRTQERASAPDALDAAFLWIGFGMPDQARRALALAATMLRRAAAAAPAAAPHPEGAAAPPDAVRPPDPAGLADPADPADELTVVLAMLAKTAAAVDRLEEALAAQTELVELLRAAPSTDPAELKLILAQAILDLGHLRSELRHDAAAEEAFTEAVAIQRELAVQDEPGHCHSLALAVTSLGVSQLVQRKLDQAEETLSQAIDWYRKAHAGRPDKPCPDFAKALGLLALALDLKHDHLRAEPVRAEEVEAIRRLEPTDAQGRYDLAYALTALGSARIASDDLAGARLSLDEAVKLWRELAAEDPDTHRSHLAEALRGLGGLLLEEGQPRQAAALLRDAVKLGAEEAKRDPAEREALAEALLGLGEAHVALERWPQAEAALSHAAAIMDRLAQADPARYFDMLVTVNRELVQVYQQLDRPRPAETIVRRLLRQARDLARSNAHFLPQVAHLVLLEGAILFYRRKSRAGQAKMEEAIGLFRRLDEADPARWRPHLADALELFGEACQISGRALAAQAAFAEAKTLVP
ncbi:MAG: hypothetical protein LBD51_00250 [Bifidobacteriaceae bacterium]|nr:hypothetical protein [Bifidobacteriaceae bacterium]